LRLSAESLARIMRSKPLVIECLCVIPPAADQVASHYGFLLINQAAT
jgi:hypothetical protein